MCVWERMRVSERGEGGGFKVNKAPIRKYNDYLVQIWISKYNEFRLYQLIHHPYRSILSPRTDQLINQYIPFILYRFEGSFNPCTYIHLDLYVNVHWVLQLPSIQQHLGHNASFYLHTPVEVKEPSVSNNIIQKSDYFLLD